MAYESRHGSTKQYAQWIQEDIKCDLINLTAEKHPPLAAYDIIVIGGYLRAGKNVIAPFIRDHWSVLRDKKVILFTTSGTPPHHANILRIHEKSFPEDIRRRLKYFPLPGRISMQSLSFFDKALIAIGKMVERDESLKKDMGRDFDGVRRENLLPLLESISKIGNASTEDPM